MRKIIFILLLSPVFLTAQNNEYIQKVQTIDSTIETLYSVISGEKGEARNWDLFKYLFHKDAKLIPSGNNRQGVVGARFMTAKEYIETSGKWLLENGFFENEIGRKTDRFGNMAQVFSTYESFKSKKDTKPFMRGINSIQLLNDGKRWWIINIFWQGETPKQPIPEKYID
ncbi:hypothetical protein AAON49_11580 [Pseudotenacibaculum sp. MALMAid0570]|uniref:hypothetical protein n=1 Tax=Pseudotenacibaculum sp. MALMAid0570 TaxID=3143938 RepID=UPI0032DF0D3B